MTPVQPGKTVFVVGDGSWGTALAVVLGAAGHRVHLWSHFPEQARAMVEHRENRGFLPGIELPDTVEPTSSLEHLNTSDYILVVYPSKYLGGILDQLATVADQSVPVISCTKGIHPDGMIRPSEMIRQRLPEAPLAVLSGPSHAEEVARFLPATVVCASPQEELAVAVQEDFSTPTLRIYTSTDLLGVELAAALKNVMAIAAGISDGLELGDNAKSALMVRGLAEMTRFATAMGALPETLSGLSGIGDLITTCISPHGRNRAVGLAIARGQTLEDITGNTRMVAEGVLTARSILSMARKLNIEMPITAQINAVLFDGKAPHEAVTELMTRKGKSELE